MLVGIDHGFSFPLRYFELQLPAMDYRIVASPTKIAKIARL